MKKVVLLFATLGLLGLLLNQSFATPDGRKRYWQAACNHRSHRLNAGWWGERRRTYREANEDAEAHNNDNPGHRAGVLGPYRSKESNP